MSCSNCSAALSQEAKKLKSKLVGPKKIGKTSEEKTFSLEQNLDKI